MSIFGPTEILQAARSMIQDYGLAAGKKATENATKADMERRQSAAEAWRQIEQEIRRLQH